MRLLVTEKTTNLREPRGVVSHAEGAVVSGTETTPAINELGEGQGEGDARGGVAGTQGRTR
jgi:hypothetical protein